MTNHLHQTMESRAIRILSFAAIGLALIYTLAACVSYSLVGKFNHDEHQFFASAYLIAESGLHPYRDFAYFHMPNLAYMYAPLLNTDHPMLYLRLLNALFGFALCVVLLWHGRYLFRHHHWWVRLVIPLSVMVLVLHAHTFEHAISFIWNHGAGVLFGLLGVILLLRWSDNPERTRWLIAGGFCLGMAAGIRLSLVPVLLPILILVAIRSRGATAVFSNLVLLALGGALANLPALYFMTLHFSDFWFGNMVYPELNTAYFESRGYRRSMDFPSKLNFIDNKILSKVNVRLMIAAMAAGLVMLGIQYLAHRDRPQRHLLLVATCLVMLFLGCLAATPARKQYFFVLFPFLALLTLQVLSALDRKPWLHIAALAMMVVPLISLVGYSPYTSRARLAADLLGHHDTALRKLGTDVVEIAALTAGRSGNSTVLTLSPIYPISAGLGIDPHFATGPFAYRVSGLVPEDQARSRGLPLASDIDRIIAETGPMALLTGRERDHDEALSEAASRHGYQPHTLSSGITLWLRTE